MNQNYKDFLSQRETASNISDRLKIFISEYKKYKLKHLKPLKILDIGSGKNPEIFEYKFDDDKYYAVDYYDCINKNVYSYKKVDLNAESLYKKFIGEKFDVIFCGEVIEHLFSPDNLIIEIKKLMHKDSILILSTPNLGYYINRIMLFFGISPLFLENSSEYKFGRFFNFFGQMNKTEGHIRLFTFRALKDFLKFYNLKIIKIINIAGPWSFFLDKIMSKISKSLSATNIFVLKIKD